MNVSFHATPEFSLRSLTLPAELLRVWAVKAPQGVTANRNPLIYWSGRPESNRRRPAWEFSARPSRRLTPSHSSSLSRPPARDASHDFSPLLTRDGQYLGQYSLPEPVSRCPTVAADLGRARSAQRPRLGRCPRNPWQPISTSVAGGAGRCPERESHGFESPRGRAHRCRGCRSSSTAWRGRRRGSFW